MSPEFFTAFVSHPGMQVRTVIRHIDVSSDEVSAQAIF